MSDFWKGVLIGFIPALFVWLIIIWAICEIIHIIT